MRTADYPEVQPDFGNWLAGFADGEGSFHIHRVKLPARRTASYQCRFTIKLRADDAAILHEIRRRTGDLGNITYNKRAPGRSRPIVEWNVTSKAHCLVLVALFDAHPLRAKKARDYAIWREAVTHWARMPARRGAGGRTLASDWGRIEELRQALRQGRAYDAPLLLDPAPESPPSLWED